MHAAWNFVPQSITWCIWKVYPQNWSMSNHHWKFDHWSPNHPSGNLVGHASAASSGCIQDTGSVGQPWPCLVWIPVAASQCSYARDWQVGADALGRDDRFPRSGHSAFQWPNLLHMQHLDDRIRCSKDLRVELWLFWNFPLTFPLAWPLVLSPCETGQNPR